MTLESEHEAALDLVRFIDASPTPYHAVKEVRGRLEASGFRELDEREEWRVGAGDKICVVRGGGTIVALALGSAPPFHSGYRLIGAHTDSPNLRLKPRAESRAHGHVQLGIEVYGSPLLYTWLDRDLGIAGRVSLLDGSTHLVRVDRPVCRASSLAIHLSPTLATDGLRLNPQLHLVPSLGLSEEDGPKLLELVTGELGKGGVDVSPDGVVAYDLCLYDTAGGVLGGRNGEFIHSARLDNLASCHAATTALLGVVAAEASIGIVLYDHEEVGSQSAAGASSGFLRSVLDRIATSFAGAGADAGPRAFARSLLVSADMAHAIHPNHSDKHDSQHAPKLGAGPVVKVNAGQSYATDGPSAAAFERACRDAGVTSQRFVARNDMRCGSTIGPISAARLGVRTVDVGSAMLSMHSCRETASTADVPKMIRALTRVLAQAEAPPARA